jgi:hypothetical protein
MEKFIDKENAASVIKNVVPTGVELSPAMEHGGLFHRLQLVALQRLEVIY